MTIVIVRTDRLGDMILTLPMVGAIRSVHPSARIVFYTRTYVQPLVSRVAGVDDVVYVDAPGFDLTASLRAEHADVIFFPRPHLSEAWAAVMARIKQRVGTAFRWYSFLFTSRVRDHRSTAEHHEAEYNVRLIESAFGLASLRVALPQIDMQGFGDRVVAGPYFIVHPGSGGSARDWPAERMGEAARQLSEQTGWTAVITGITLEADLCKSVAAACPSAIDLCGTKSLEEMMSLISSAEVLVANSTGILHLAAALGIPVVGLYPQTPAMSQFRWGPYSGRAIVVESDGDDDMSSIEVTSVVNAALHAHALHPGPYQRPRKAAPSPHT